MKILLPVDGSALALDAVHHVLRLATNGLRAECVLANVQEPANLYELVTAPDPGSLQQVSQAAGGHALQAAAALLDAAGLGYVTEVASGDPAHGLLDIAERLGCDAIVIGVRGVGGLREALLGSVANTVLHDARVPVTIVRRAAPADTADAAVATPSITDADGDGVIDRT